MGYCGSSTDTTDEWACEPGKDHEWALVAAPTLEEIARWKRIEGAVRALLLTAFAQGGQIMAAEQPAFDLLQEFDDIEHVPLFINGEMRWTTKRS